MTDATATVRELLAGSWAAQTVRTMAELGVADQLAAGHRTLDDLAAATGTHPPSLARLLRALTAIGLCTTDPDGGYGLTLLGELIRADVPESRRARALTFEAPYFRRAWDELPDAIRTGEAAFPKVHGVGFWDYLSAHPKDQVAFDEAMAGGTADGARTLLAAVDLTGAGTLVDVGGGNGSVLATVLAERPELRGILLDRPESVADAPAVFAAAGVADRATSVGGDFFVEVPAGGDVYLLGQIVHDWPDAAALEILRTCAASMTPGTRIWLYEQVVAASNEMPSAAHALLDLTMLVCFGARERTGAEYADLLRAAGFTGIRVAPTAGDLSVVEAVRT